MKRWLPALYCAFLWTASLPTALALDDGWPRTLPVDEGLVTIYPLQAERLEGDVLSYRAALAWRPTPEAEPVFGAGWFESMVVIDEGQRIVYTLGLKVTNTRFPEGTADIQSKLAAAVAEQAPGWNLTLSLDDLDAGLRTARAEAESVQKLNTVPPRIVYRDHPAVLLNLDGDPVLRDIENSPFKAVVNTPYPLISDGRKFYLNAARDVWYRADNATGPYRYEANPPADIAAMVKLQDDNGMVETAAEPITAANAPEVVVATEPTELIVTDGPAVFVPLVDDLLVLQNSDDDVFMHVRTQKYYIVLAGRWYHAASLKGPWAYQAADRLPADFAKIPRDSAQADSRVYVAGTTEAKEAVLDAQVPQTQAVARGSADVQVEYDGEPDFAPVEGTDLEYAANTGSTVLQSDRRYYLVEDGVWYESATPNGPWQVATRRPDGVESIAPTSPVYNTKYVYVYGYTPSVVYVGYTPGYLGSYVYYDTVVYGTGWYYRPWISPWYYYPRPSTWGFHVAYNSWDGWSFGLSWNWGWGWGPFYTGFYSGGYWHRNHYWYRPYCGYWRPRSYRPPRYYAHHAYSGSRRDYGHRAYTADRRDYARGGYSGDRRWPSGHRDNRQPRSGDYPGSRDNRSRDPRGGSVPGRDAAIARRSKVPLYQPEPIRRSDLRLKARARDINAAASRDLMVADNRGDVHAARDHFRTRDNASAPGGVASKMRGSRTEPVRAGNPRIRSDQPRPDRYSRATEPRFRADATPPARRAGAAATSPANRGDERGAARNRAARSPAVAADQPSPRTWGGPSASRPTPTATPRPQAAPPANRVAPAQRQQGPSVRRAQPRPSAMPAPSRSRGAPLPTARARAPAPSGPSNRSAAPPPRQASSPRNAGRPAQAARAGAQQGRRDRSHHNQ